MAKNKTLLSILIIAVSIMTYANNRKNKTIKNPHTVIVIREVKKGKESLLKNELKKVMELSRQEATCLDYHVHENLNNAAQFVLYERWESPEAHQKQFEKDYIIELAHKLDDLLAKPYIVILAKDL